MGFCGVWLMLLYTKKTFAKWLSLHYFNQQFFNMLMPAENANIDLPLLGFFDLLLYRFCNDWLFGAEKCA
jgi:hypothetical protein